jgi:hypothetical protein
VSARDTLLTGTLLKQNGSSEYVNGIHVAIEAAATVRPDQKKQVYELEWDRVMLLPAPTQAVVGSGLSRGEGKLFLGDTLSKGTGVAK